MEGFINPKTNNKEMLLFLFFCSASAELFACTQGELQSNLGGVANVLTDFYTSVITDSHILINYVLDDRVKTLPAWSQEYNDLSCSSYCTDNSSIRISDVYFPEWSKTQAYNWTCGIDLMSQGIDPSFAEASGCTYPYDEHITSFCNCSQGCPYYCLHPNQFGNSRQRFFFELFKSLDYIVPAMLSNNIYVNRLYSYDAVGGVRTPTYYPYNIADFLGPDYMWSILLPAYPTLNPNLFTYWSPNYFDTGLGVTMTTAFTPIVSNGEFLGVICADVMLSGTQTFITQATITPGSVVFVTDHSGSIISADQKAYNHIFCPDVNIPYCQSNFFNITELNIQQANTNLVPPGLSQSIRGLSKLIALIRDNPSKGSMLVSSEYWTWQSLNLPYTTYTVVSVTPQQDIDMSAIWNINSSITITRSRGVSIVILSNQGYLSLCWRTIYPSWLTVNPDMGCIDGYKNTYISISVDWNSIQAEAIINILPNNGTGYESCFHPLSMSVYPIYDMVEDDSILFTINPLPIILALVFSLIGGWLSGILMEHNLSSQNKIWWISSGIVITLSGIWTNSVLITCSIQPQQHVEIGILLWLLSLLSTLIVTCSMFWFLQSIDRHRIYNIELPGKKRIEWNKLGLISVCLNFTSFISNFCCVLSLQINANIYQEWSIVIPILITAMVFNFILLRLTWTYHKTIAYLTFLIPSFLLTIAHVFTLQLTFHQSAFNMSIQPGIAIFVAIALSCIVCAMCMLLNSTTLRLSRDALDKELDNSRRTAGRWQRNALLAMEKHNVSRQFLSAINNIRPHVRSVVNNIYLSRLIGITSSQSEPRSVTSKSSIQEPVLVKSKTNKSVNLVDILRNPLCLELFKDQLISEHSEELVLFWLDAETYETNHKLLTPSQQKEFALYLQATYIGQGATYQVNISSEQVKYIQKYITEHRINLFDAAKKECIKLMTQQTYKTFLETPQYQICLQILEKSFNPLESIDFSKTEEKESSF